MAKAPKTYKIHITGCSYGGREINDIKEMTLEECRNYFGYTLEIGASYNEKINPNAKTIRGLITAINKAFDVRFGRCYRTWESVSLIND